MKNEINNLRINEEYLNSHRAIPFTLSKKLKGVEVHTWNTNQAFFPEEMKNKKEGEVVINNSPIRMKYFMDNVKEVGLDDLAMPDQPKGEKLVEDCHEITFEEFAEYYESDTAKKQGTIWNVDKNYTAIFMTKDTFDKIQEKYHRSISLVFPAADCAVVRYYDKDKEIIGLTHSDGWYTGENIVRKMTEYMKEHFHSDIEKLEVYVGAFAKEDWEYTGLPNFAVNKDEEGNILSYHGDWPDYIESIGDNKYKLHYGDMLYNQLVQSGILKDNIYFSPENTLFNKEYFSHSRSVIEQEKEGRNLFGITFDKEKVVDNSKETGTILK